ncbi:hypothetical protein HMPREF0326_01811 [Desulfovibrio sp. 3_1_syn3]|nr:hypothetical protein HMPREF0326_01811 [Desulfovibrio sp. 3_1_syn3]
MDFARKRWLSLGAAMLSALLVGVIYSFSVYVNPLVERYGWSKGAVSLAYTLNIVITAIVPLLVGKYRARMPISRYTFIGSVIYAVGILLCGFIRGSVYEFYLYFGVITGAGIGIVYTSLATYVVQMFPDRKGLAAGLYTACYGCAPFFWAPLASYLISTFGIENAFKYIGVFFIVGLILVTRFLREIPMGFTEAMSAHSGNTTPQAPSLYEKSPRQLLSTPLFYVIMLLYTFGMSCGAMALSLGSPILQSTLHYSPEAAAIVVGFFAIASATGRLFWGGMSDKIGRPNVLICLCLITLISMSVLSMFTTEVLFVSAILLIPFCYGAYACTISPVAVECFGTRHFAQNYNVVFQVFAFSAIIGPQVIAYSEAATGGFRLAFMVACAFAVLGLFLAVLVKLMVNRARAAQKNENRQANAEEALSA